MNRIIILLALLIFVNPLFAEMQINRRGRNFTEYTDIARPGKKAINITVHDQNYQDDGGQWQQVDENFENDNTVDGGVTFTSKSEKAWHRIKTADDGTRRIYPRRGVTNEYIQFGKLQYRNTSNQWVDVPLGSPTRNGNIITWDQINFALKLTHIWRQVKIEVTLKNSNAARPVRWRVTLNGLTWNNWTLYGGDGSVVGIVDKPIGWDANGSAGSPNITVTPSYASGYVTFTASLSGAVYPVVIDPTFSSQPGATGNDTMTHEGAGNVNWGSGGTFALNTAAGQRRIGLIRFDLSGMESGATITSATMGLYNESAISGKTITVYPILTANSSWGEGVSTWNYESTTDSSRWAGDAASNGGTDAGCSVSGTDYRASSIGSFTLAASSLNTFALAAADVQTWYGGSNYGMAVVKTTADSDIPSFTTSEGSTAGNRPNISIEYTTAGGSAPSRRRPGRGFGL